MSTQSSGSVNPATEEFVVQQGKGTRYGNVPLWLLHACKPSEIVIYIALTGYINLPDGARPSVKRLAEDTRLSPAQVERGIRAMREARVLLVHQRWDGKRQLPSRYILAFDGPFHESQVPTMRIRKRGAIVSDGTRAIVGEGTVPSPVRDEVDTSVTHIKLDTFNTNTADALSATKPSPTTRQGKTKNAQRNKEFDHHPGDNSTDRFIRWVGIAIDAETRDEVWEYLRVDGINGWTYDVGQWDATDWLGALRRLIGGFDDVRAHNDRELRELIETAKTSPEGMAWLVEYVTDLQWDVSSLTGPPSVASSSSKPFSDSGDPWAPAAVSVPSGSHTGAYMGGPVGW